MRRIQGGLSASRILLIGLGLLALRLASMAWVPYLDTSEPRYADIARMMAQSGDWITPWFEPGVPFWGKPPLSFWLQALSMKVFGLSELAGRLPSWLVTLATLFPLHATARVWAGRRAAACAVLLYVSCALPFVAAGAVLTDAFLVLGTTLVMAALVLRQPYWRVLGVIGMAVGLLSKGPLAMVLVAGPVVLCVLLCRQWPGISVRQAAIDMMASLALAAPWYLMAEWKTPGFLDYFIVGEHVRRYLDPGWAGDLYGTAHRRPYGSIWIEWLQASLPWGPAALATLLFALRRNPARQRLARLARQPLNAYLLAWALFTPIFFTVASNVIWTYLLPALPAFAILAGRWLAVVLRRCRRGTRRAALGAAALVPVLTVGAVAAVVADPLLAKSERGIVRYFDAQAPDGARLWYAGSRPFSARYYSEGRAELVPVEAIPAMLAQSKDAVYIAASPHDMARIQALPGVQTLLQTRSKRFVLVLAASQGN